LIGRALLEFDANRRMFCFDTFEGLPPPTSGDLELSIGQANAAARLRRLMPCFAALD
jgi:hypothetical protein